MEKSATQLGAEAIRNALGKIALPKEAVQDVMMGCVLQVYCTVECFPRFCFIVKTSADNVILQIFNIFTNELSLFSTQLSLLRNKNSIELKNDSIHW